MVMSSHEISAITMQQQAMFGNMASYAQQATPPYAAQQQTYSQNIPAFGGYTARPAPAPPMPTYAAPGYTPGTYGGAMGMGQAMFQGGGPGMYTGQMVGEQLLGTGLGGLATAAGGMETLGGWASTGAGIAGMMGMGGPMTRFLGGTAFGTGAAGLFAGGMVAGAPLLGLEAANFGAQQLYAGYQQRQAVNRVMRNRFGGAMGVGGGRGGMGFSTEEMGQMSSMIREMSGQDMFTSFDELVGVMDQTSQMGMYRGVQSAREFRDRFRETVDTLKEVARTMHTSLGEATQFMESQRQLGFFTGTDISANLMQTRVAAGASGMSMQQLQQIQMQGTQMGRAMGMRGRTGATAMREFATNIAIAQRTGTLSDEMMAEATGGLTGSEGAQAMAGRMMELNQRWFQRGPGRVMLAALWDPETGGVSEERIQQVMSGNLSFQELRRMGRANIAGTGGRRSEFFAQEERIRGEAMAAAGGDIRLGMLEQHLARRRGVTADDPIGQRWLRRQTGWSQSELEAVIEMRRDAPRMMEERRIRTRQQIEQAAQNRAREGTGLTGLQRRWAQKWEKSVEDPLRQVADDLVTSWTQAVEGLQRDIEGVVEVTVSDRTRQAVVELAQTGKTEGLLTGGRYQQWLQGLDIQAGRQIAQGGLVGGIGRMIGARGPTLEQRIAKIQPLLTGEQKREISGADLATQSAFYNKFMARAAGATGTGIPEADVSRLAASMRSIVEERVGLGAGLESWQRARGMAEEQGGDALATVINKRIVMLAAHDPELGAVLMKGDFAQKAARLRQLEVRSGLGEAFRTPTFGGGVDITDFAAVQAAAKLQEEKAYEALGQLVFDGPEGLEKEGFWASLLPGSRASREIGLYNVAADIEGSGKDLQSAMKKKEIRELFLRTQTSDPVARKAALKNLYQKLSMGEEEIAVQFGIDKGEIKAVRRLADLVRNKDEKVQSVLRQLNDAVVGQQTSAVREREMKLGAQLSAELAEEGALAEALTGMGGAKEALQEIASARAAGKLGKAYELEQAFYEQFGGEEGATALAGALGTGPAMYMGIGLERYKTVMGRYGGRGGREAALFGALGGLGIRGGRKVFDRKALRDIGGIAGLRRKLQEGMSPEELISMLSKQAKRKLGAVGVGVSSKELAYTLERVAGKFTEEEQREIAGREAAAAAAGGRAGGAGGERRGLTELAAKQLGHLEAMVRLQKITIETISNEALDVNELKAVFKEAGVSGVATQEGTQS